MGKRPTLTPRGEVSRVVPIARHRSGIARHRAYERGRTHARGQVHHCTTDSAQGTLGTIRILIRFGLSAWLCCTCVGVMLCCIHMGATDDGRQAWAAAWAVYLVTSRSRGCWVSGLSSPGETVWMQDMFHA
eukprot:CAMPEP_0181257740 /NCGR_PEP_ID=MMETSP1096-20121128/50412_1 /TAXON_ID=156174 ORGANISM="Chrysochromulina ericina, Strain CCMP281" /NCGR_SAMPLE_ID=MMETSP1096 /ASSEMBLY_ACC=CAM_ASM_000453 /LENGTH=130 /DNA_ID=CAMNT_0023356091 /DNA_START=118 /DNA_END=507 /DNA_ORIENTATION=+